MRVSPERAEAAGAMLLELCPEGFEEADVPGRVEFAVYVDAERARRIEATFDVASSVAVPAGWEDAWRAFHRSVRVGPLWIGPPWEPPPSDAVPIVIDPGRAFGTGAHATTRLCLELLLGEEPGAIVDAGCGSGVLAVAAAKLGFGPVLAVDVEEAAVDAARANARANGVAIEVWQGDALAEPLPDAGVAVANLELALVEELLGRRLPPRIVVSGFLAADDPRRRRWRLLERRELDGWAAELLVREPGSSDAG